MRSRAACILIAGTALFTGCITPSVIDSSGRAIEPTSVMHEWRPAQTSDFDGLFESVSIEGEVAAALWKIYYVFSTDGSYSGAALVLGGAAPEFQTLSGRWMLDGDRLDLGDGRVVHASADENHIRLESEGGVAILRRSAIQ